MSADEAPKSSSSDDDLLGLFGPRDPHDDEVPERTADEASDQWLSDMRVHRDHLSGQIEALERMQREKAAGSNLPELTEIESELVKLTNHELDLAEEAYDCPFECWVQIDPD